MSAKPSFLEPQFQGEYGHSPWPTQKCPSFDPLRLLANQHQSAPQQNAASPISMKLNIDLKKSASIKGAQIAVISANQQLRINSMETTIKTTENDKEETSTKATEICGVNLIGGAADLKEVLSAITK